MKLDLWERDQTLLGLLPEFPLLSPDFPDRLEMLTAVKTTAVQLPDDEYKFLHEAAIIEYHGILFASWYNCAEKELTGHTPIRGRRSADGGRSWSSVEVLSDDPEGKLLSCPPVYGICDDKLYLLVNMMTAFDAIHSLDIYEFSESDSKFHLMKSSPVPFKLNTNVYALDNGKLLLPGRMGELDHLPETPAVLISDSGKINTDWRMVKMQKDHLLPDGACMTFPECSAIVMGSKIYVFCRNDQRNVPLLYCSEDYGETWKLYRHNIPFSGSKIYSGTLHDGRNYVIGNLQFSGRDKLAIFFSAPGTMNFISGGLIRDGFEGETHLFPDRREWSYPVACEYNGKLYVIYTKDKTGAMLSVIDL